MIQPANIAELRSALVAARGSDRLRRIAQMAGCHYYTVGRIARGEIRSPNVELFQRLARAVVDTTPANDATSDRCAVVDTTPANDATSDRCAAA